MRCIGDDINKPALILIRIESLDVDRIEAKWRYQHLVLSTIFATSVFSSSNCARPAKKFRDSRICWISQCKGAGDGKNRKTESAEIWFYRTLLFKSLRSIAGGRRGICLAARIAFRRPPWTPPSPSPSTSRGRRSGDARSQVDGDELKRPARPGPAFIAARTDGLAGGIYA